MLKKRIIRLAAGFAAGAAFSGARLFGLPVPLAAVLPAVLPADCGVSSALGAAVFGAIILKRQAVPLVAALIAAVLLKLHKFPTGANPAALVPGVYILAAAAISVLSGGGFGGIFGAAVSGFVFGVFFAAYSKASKFLDSSSPIPVPLAAFCFFGGVFAMSGAGREALSAGAVVGAYAALLLAVRYGPGAACLGAVLAAAGAGLCDPADFSCLALLGIPAAICGFTSYGSPVRAAAVMLASILPSAAVFGLNMRSLAVLLDCALAAVLFVATYPCAARLCSAIAEPAPAKRYSYRSAALRAALSDISERLYRLSEREPEKPGSYSEAVYAKVCSGCKRAESCRGEGIAATERLSDSADFYRALPGCERVPEIRTAGAEAKRRETYISLKTSESRETARFCSDMLLGLESVISDLERLSGGGASDRLFTDRLEKSLKRRGFRLHGVSVSRSGRCEIALPLAQKINEVRLCSIASEITGADYLKPERSILGESALLKLTPKPSFSADSGSCQLSAKKEASGDVAECFTCGSCFYALLSDGMGRGNGARAAASALVGVLRELVCAGFSVKTSVILSSLILKASLPEESFATLDLLKIDLATGAAEVYKAGGCESFLILDGERSRLRAGGYPVGIISPCETPPQRFYVKNEALILMMTDGAQGLSFDSFQKLTEEEKSLPLHELAALLTGRCGSENCSRTDDVSLLLVKIRRIAADSL